jgi:hypothetical protein
MLPNDIDPKNFGCCRKVIAFAHKCYTYVNYARAAKKEVILSMKQAA